MLGRKDVNLYVEAKSVRILKVLCYSYKKNFVLRTVYSPIRCV
jgi:hypothetical protein